MSVEEGRGNVVEVTLQAHCHLPGTMRRTLLASTLAIHRIPSGTGTFSLPISEGRREFQSVPGEAVSKAEARTGTDKTGLGNSGQKRYFKWKSKS